MRLCIEVSDWAIVWAPQTTQIHQRARTRISATDNSDMDVIIIYHEYNPTKQKSIRFPFVIFRLSLSLSLSLYVYFVSVSQSVYLNVYMRVCAMSRPDFDWRPNVIFVVRSTDVFNLILQTVFPLETRKTTSKLFVDVVKSFHVTFFLISSTGFRWATSFAWAHSFQRCSILNCEFFENNLLNEAWKWDLCYWRDSNWFSHLTRTIENQKNYPILV